jgi:hypothetical protein
MTDQVDIKGGNEAANTPNSKRKSTRMRTAMMTMGLLLAEAGLIGGGFMMFSEPTRTEASDMSTVMETAAMELELAEVLIFDDHLFNETSGIGFMYSTKVYLEVDQRDKSWLEIEAQGAPGKIEAALMSIWKSASRRDLDSDELGALEARVARALANNGLFDRRPGSMRVATTEQASGGPESGNRGIPNGPIIHDVIVVMELGRRVNR